MSDLLKDTDINLDCIEKLAQQALIPVERDADGGLLLRTNGVNTFVRVDTNRKIIRLVAICPLLASSTTAQRLEYANTMNDRFLLVRFVITKADQLWCDYQFCYEGGITSFNIMNTYRRFVSVCRDALAAKENTIVGLEPQAA